jgi:NTP pyrophosphatase (non-canonical NTP hydrolase)
MEDTNKSVPVSDLPDMPTLAELDAELINGLADECHEANMNWWLDLTRPCVCQIDGPERTVTCQFCEGLGYAKKDRNVGELLMLCVSELAEAMEGHRKDLMDDKLPHRKQFEVELADCLIRIFDLAGGKGLDLGGAFVQKMAFNKSRADHKIEQRQAEGGKKY